jgi:hypothetical protein
VTVASLAADFRHALDPCAIARDVGIEPDPWQAELLEEPPARVLMCCGRQVGKSTASSLIALNAAIYQAPALILMVSPSLRQSVELYRRLHGFWERLPGRPEAQYETLSRLELANGSRILSLPGSERTVRGISAADLIILDEAAGVEDELLAAIRPMLAISDGKMFALTTPKGKRGWFYEQWLRGVGWHRVMVRASECQRISQEFLDQEREILGPMMYAQEYECEFIDDTTQAFDTELIRRALVDDFRPFIEELEAA